MEGEGDVVVLAKLSVLREMYELVDEADSNSASAGGAKGGGAGEGFYRLVEGAIRGPGGIESEGGIRRVDSTAQLEYWE